MNDLLGVLPSGDTLDGLTAAGVLMLVAFGVITDKLVWHTRLKKAEARAERWEKVALESLAAGALAGVKAAEVTVDVVSNLPDPARQRSTSP